jgi:hypothetical protein
MHPKVAGLPKLPAGVATGRPRATSQDREELMSDMIDSNDDALSQEEALTAEELRELAAESDLEATPEQMRALLEFIQDAGGIDEAKTLIERLKSAA